MMPLHTSYKILGVVMALVGVVVVGVLYVLLQSRTVSSINAPIPQGKMHTITLGEGGYEPEELTLKKGDVVTFQSSRGFEHWPASNLHPTHNLYAAFDPKRPLLSDETWTFQFTQVGTWEFHDHLNSTFTGTITVIE